MPCHAAASPSTHPWLDFSRVSSKRNRVTKPRRFLVLKINDRGLGVIDLKDARFLKKSLIVNVQNTCWYFTL